ncbi:hypothetical protein [Pseudogemmobacter hezensis]|uniref:hypothetical protein n=1 Tax=Pseudogemmobacter hezensis TaxID=2737662 RepID=UPI0020A626CC|nr:hypothetical protein [Pseudogemmobacter hezensis]
MSDDDLPYSWLDLLREAEGRPESTLSLIGPEADPETEQVAERLTDRGLFRVVSAKRYQLTDAGREALARSPRSKLRNITSKRGWFSRLLSRR